MGNLWIPDQANLVEETLGSQTVLEKEHKMAKDGQHKLDRSGSGGGLVGGGVHSGFWRRRDLSVGDLISEGEQESSGNSTASN